MGGYRAIVMTESLARVISRAGESDHFLEILQLQLDWRKVRGGILKKVGLSEGKGGPSSRGVVARGIPAPKPPTVRDRHEADPRVTSGRTKRVSTKGVSMKRSNFPNFRAFCTVVSKRNFQKFPGHGYPFCGNFFGPCRLPRARYPPTSGTLAFSQMNSKEYRDFFF